MNEHVSECVMKEQRSDGFPPAVFDRLLLGFSLLITVLTLGWVLFYCRYGFEFADEGYFLAWISNPTCFDAFCTAFGGVYHPMYLLLDGNIATMRQVNVLITWGLAWGLCYAFLREQMSAGMSRCPLLCIGWVHHPHLYKGVGKIVAQDIAFGTPLSWVLVK